MKKEIGEEQIEEAIEVLTSGGADLSKILQKDGLIKQLGKRLLEKALEGEMQDHLGYSRHERSEVNNARNGYSSKSVITNQGPITVEVPRDRESKFTPAIIPKRTSRIDGLDQKILSLYAKGMSLSDIRLQLQELYGAEVSESLISKITDEVIEDVKTWQMRPLDRLYPVVYFDGLVVKVREDKRIINKSV